MKIRDVMTSDVQTISPTETIPVAARLLAELDVGALVVTSAGRPEGILTDRDILIRVVAESRDMMQTTVAEVMSSALFMCRPDDPVDETVQQMAESQIRRMPVVDENDLLIGIVTLSDIAKAQAGDIAPG